MDVFLEVVSTSPGDEDTLQGEVSMLLCFLLDPFDAGREGDLHHPARAVQHFIHVPFFLFSSFYFFVRCTVLSPQQSPPR